MTALVRPEAVRVVPDEHAVARVLAVSFLGALCRVQVAAADETVVVGQVSAAEASALSPGTAVRVEIVPTPVFATEA